MRSPSSLLIQKGQDMKFIPIVLAVVSFLSFIEGVVWEVVLQPLNPIVPIVLIASALGGFFLAGEECKG